MVGPRALRMVVMWAEPKADRKANQRVAMKVVRKVDQMVGTKADHLGTMWVEMMVAMKAESTVAKRVGRKAEKKAE